MNTKVADTFGSSEFRLQAVLSRTYDPEPPEGGTPNCKLTNEGCRQKKPFFKITNYKKTLD